MKRAILGWLIILLVCCVGVAGIVIVVGLAVRSDGAMKYVTSGSALAVMVSIAYVALRIRNKILGVR